MRLRACLGSILLAILGACDTIPQAIKVEVDGRTIELKRKPPPVEAATVPGNAGAEPQ